MDNRKRRNNRRKIQKKLTNGDTFNKEYRQWNLVFVDNRKKNVDNEVKIERSKGFYFRQ